ncbi:MAG: hypothetical protein ACTSRH_04455 [Promethearchaeota archaeon]
MVKNKLEHKIVKKIQIEYSPEIVKALKQGDIPFEIWKIIDLDEELRDKNVDNVLISIPRKIYNDLDKLCKIANWNTEKKIVSILEEAVLSAELTDVNGFPHVDNF